MSGVGMAPAFAAEPVVVAGFTVALMSFQDPQTLDKILAFVLEMVKR